MKYKKIEAKLKTDKSKDYLWNKMNTPKKIIKIEAFGKNTSIKKISDNNYELKSKEYLAFITFIPKKAVNLMFVYKTYSLLAWFEIKGEKKCTISHGAYRPVKKLSLKAVKKEAEHVKEHFLEELMFISK